MFTTRNVSRNILSFLLCKSCKRFFASLPNVARSDGIISISYPLRTAFFWWSRELPPYYLAIAGLHHPLREPYLPLSKYTALSLFGQKNSLIVN